MSSFFSSDLMSQIQNPSTDEQAMARIWRDGQKKNVYIYRFVSTATIEEKMFQRQIVKKGLSKTVVDDKATKASFSKEMLKELFNYDETARCETYADEAINGSNVDHSLEKIDPVLYSAITAASTDYNDDTDSGCDGDGRVHSLVTFVKHVMDKDEDAYRLTMDNGESDEDEVGKSSEDEKVEEEEEEDWNMEDGEEEFQFGDDTSATSGQRASKKRKLANGEE